MVVLLDTNILLDYLETREPYFEDYNAETEICLREVPNIKMTLGEIFEGIMD